MVSPTLALFLGLLPLVLTAPVDWLPDGHVKNNNIPFNLPTGRIDNSGPKPAPPVFPKQYEVKYQFSMPYTLAYQATPLSYDVHFWYDDESGHMKIATLGGIDETVILDKYTWKGVPRIDEPFCFYMRNAEDSMGLTGEKGIPQDFGNWTYAGRTDYEGRDADIWVESIKMFDRVEYYYFYISTDGHPLFLSVMGQNWFSGSHFDQYLAKFDYDSWKPGPLADDAFQLPNACYEKKTTRFLEHTESPGLGMLTLVPRFFRGDAEYDAHAAEHGRHHAHPEEYHSRLAIFKANKEMIETHNARNDVSYTLGLNKFADWTEDEFRSTALGRKPSTNEDSLEDIKSKAPKHQVSGKELPESLDWEGTLSDGIVKDQANCGSCWTFGAVATMQAAWYLATGERLSFSEQQIVDCAWDYDVWGCDGGWAELAIQYVVDNGGIMIENDYRYIGQNDWCRFNTTQAKNEAAGFFSGYAVIPPNDTVAIKDALYTKGPLSVALDVNSLHFRFYTGGVYDNANCSEVLLDHVVTMVGYGEENGKPYFKLRNSWSKYWGQEGYFKIAQEHDCGVDTDAIYAIVDEEKAKEARMRRKNAKDAENN